MVYGFDTELKLFAVPTNCVKWLSSSSPLKGPEGLVPSPITFTVYSSTALKNQNVHKIFRLPAVVSFISSLGSDLPNKLHLSFISSWINKLIKNKNVQFWKL